MILATEGRDLFSSPPFDLVDDDPNHHWDNISKEDI